MKIGILSDTHDHLNRTQVAVELLIDRGAQALVHCGDLTGPPIVEACCKLPFYFVFGNHDSDMASILADASAENGGNCLRWGGELSLSGKRIAVAHGHFPKDFRPLLAKNPDYFLFGHSHQTHDSMDGSIRRINPGALFRAEKYSIALLDLLSDELEFITIPRGR